jgi:hypothetical protein
MRNTRHAQLKPSDATNADGDSFGRLGGLWRYDWAQACEEGAAKEHTGAGQGAEAESEAVGGRKTTR